MMSDTTEESIPKLVDFGLAKMIGPNEKALEPFGTLGYVAPEVLVKPTATWLLAAILVVGKAKQTTIEDVVNTVHNFLMNVIP